MANFFSGMVKGGVLAAVALVTASVLLPARPKIAPTEAASQGAEIAETAKPLAAPAQTSAPSQPETAEPASAAPAAQPAVAAPEVPPAVPPAVVTPALVTPVENPPAPTDSVPSAAGPKTATPAEITTPPPPVLAKEALLDPSDPMGVAEPSLSGAKTVTAPMEGIASKIGTETIAATSQSISEKAALQPAVPAINAPPLQKYAARFDDPGTKPLFAVILRDTGALDVDRATLAALPFPVTFAIDPDSENAAQAMAIYRAAGKEVVMLAAGLPTGATAQDLEQAFQSYETVLPETVAIMGPAKGGFQDNAVLSKLIVPVIAAQGRGLVTFDRGLNSAAQNAARDGVAQGLVFRQIDGMGESVPVIRRYLDRAVFKAAQDGAAMVMGETLPDTITALTEWTIEGKATQVTLAPVSAILR